MYECIDIYNVVTTAPFSQHKTMLISAQLVINPIMLPILMPLPLYLHIPLEAANAAVLVLSAVSPHGLCAQLHAQLGLAEQGLAHGAAAFTAPTTSNSSSESTWGSTPGGWLRGELAVDWPVCISTSSALDKVRVVWRLQHRHQQFPHRLVLSFCTGFHYICSLRMHHAQHFVCWPFLWPSYR
jgi:hypothetical protein